MSPSPPFDDDISFDSATRLRPREGHSTFDVDVPARWTVGDKPNGGFLLALLEHAAARSLQTDGDDLPDAVSATITFVAPPALSAAEIRTTVLRRGRTAAQVRAVLVQSDRPMVDAVFVMGTLAANPTSRYSDVGPLGIPEPARCVRLPPQMPDGTPAAILETTELRLDPSTLPSASLPAPMSDPVAELRGWVRFVDGRPPDARSLLYFVDAIPPATLLIGSTGWVPTLSMSAYLRAQPAPGWVGIRLTAHHVASGMVDESCTLWDADGQVVAQAWQLARLRFPDDRA
ncbi:MAG: thioesterase family protein [Acidimicrobiales bacterium]